MQLKRLIQSLIFINFVHGIILPVVKLGHTLIWSFSYYYQLNYIYASMFSHVGDISIKYVSNGNLSLLVKINQSN